MMKGKPLTPPVVFSATYRFDNTDDMIDVAQNRTGYIYSRWDNPTVCEAEKRIAQMEGYEKALAFGSGMAAISTTIMALAGPGSRIVALNNVYGGTFELIHSILPKWGIEVAGVNCDEPGRIHEEIAKGLSLLYLETPTNPLLSVVDVAPLAKAAHDKGALVLLDSTFASPVNQRPIELGADVTLHSATKYLSGHHDITAGFACCNSDLAKDIWQHRKLLGGILDPMTAFLAMRGMETLDIRVERQNANAMHLATFLAGHPKINVVNYPGLKSHPGHEIAKRQMKGFGGMLSFEVDADFETTKQFVDRLKIIEIATSLGGVSSLINQPATNTHACLTAEERREAGIIDSLVRLSAGIDDVELIEADLAQALDAV